MSLITPARSEGTVEVGGGRTLGYAQFGAKSGRALFWMHGTPGGRRQIPEAARRIADETGLRIIGVDRPGVGDSTPHLYDSISDFATDLARVFDHLEVDRAAVVGLSGGGPYALAAAGVMPRRIAAVGILGGVAPTRGNDAAKGGPVSLAVPFGPLLTLLRDPIGAALSGVIRLTRPLASPAFDVVTRAFPKGDRLVFSEPEMKEMFLDDLLQGSERRLQAPIFDAILFTRHWGFSLSSVTAPVHWWHGDSDPLVPLHHAHHMAERLPSCTLSVRPGESHLGGMGAAPEVISTLLSAWDRHDPNFATGAAGR